MSIEKPFRVEVIVDAPRDVVWRELTEPERIRHWFGWDSEELEAEIQFIFVEHGRQVGQDRLELVQDGFVELVSLGDRTLIRAVKPGDLDAAEWQDVYGDIEEGWITFFNQLRHRLAHDPQGARRMVVKTGSVVPSSVTLEGSPWHESRYQRGVDIDGTLVIVGAKAPRDSTEPADTMLLVTTYDLDDEAFAAVEQRWTSWWESVSQ